MIRLTDQNISEYLNSKSGLSLWKPFALSVRVCKGIPCMPLQTSTDSGMEIYVLFYLMTLEDRRGTADDFETITFSLNLSSAALDELANSIPVHSLILSYHFFFCSSLLFFLSLCPVARRH